MSHRGLTRALSWTFVFLASTLSPEAAFAGRLEPAADSPGWMHLGADVLLVLHIAGGAIGIASGTIASLSKKGARVHRISGWIFFVSMATCYVIAAGVAPFLEEGWRTNTVAAVFSLYLLLSGVRAARVRCVTSGLEAQLGLLLAGSVTALGMLFAIQGAQDPTGTLDGSPPQAFITFILGGLAATADEARLLRRGELRGRARLARHIWRMCASFFYASGSFFLGQPQVFPAWFNATPLPSLLAFFPLFVMVWFLWDYRPRASAA